MPNKLSHSQVSKFTKCGYAHYLHYEKKLRPKVTSAALVFGSALDEAINQLLYTKMDEPPVKPKDPMAAFLDRWERGWINKNLVDLPMSTRIVYAASDYDSDLLTNTDIMKLSQCRDSLALDEDADVLELVETFKQEKKQSAYKFFPEPHQQYINYAAWLCNIRKAEFIIKAYKEQVLPKIKKVIAIQKNVELENDEGDSVTGFIDIIVEWEDGKTYILDNKSSAREYDEDAVKESPQLALYALIENNKNVGFIVYLKAIKKNKVKTCQSCGYVNEGTTHKTCNKETKSKRCGGTWDEVINPEAIIQIMLGETNERLEDMVLKNFNDINNMVKNKIYFRNLDTCHDHYGSTCPYLKHCFNDNNEDLETV